MNVFHRNDVARSISRTCICFPADMRIELCPAGRGGTPDEVGTVGALLMGPGGGFIITGSDFLMDGGVTAAYRFSELAP